MTETKERLPLDSNKLMIDCLVPFLTGVPSVPDKPILFEEHVELRWSNRGGEKIGQESVL